MLRSNWKQVLVPPLLLLVWQQVQCFRILTTFLPERAFWFHDLSAVAFALRLLAKSLVVVEAMYFCSQLYWQSMPRCKSQSKLMTSISFLFSCCDVSAQMSNVKFSAYAYYLYFLLPDSLCCFQHVSRKWFIARAFAGSMIIDCYRLTFSQETIKCLLFKCYSKPMASFLMLYGSCVSEC